MKHIEFNPGTEVEFRVKKPKNVLKALKQVKKFIMKNNLPAADLCCDKYLFYVQRKSSIQRLLKEFNDYSDSQMKIKTQHYA